MNRLPRHTPYGDTPSVFQIGLKPVEFESWIEVDDQIGPYLEEKHRLHGEHPDRVFVAETDTEAGQQEVLDLLIENLLENHAEIYKRSGSVVSIGDTGHEVDLDKQSIPPLLKAAFLVQEDLALMRRSDEGWCLVAGSVSFPSSWSLQEKFGKPLQEIHAPVPGFQAGSRNALIINRIFDNLDESQLVERFNWSIFREDELYQEGREDELLHWDQGQEFLDAWFRVERQTLRKLPGSGDVLFTIRIHQDQVNKVVESPVWKRIGPVVVETVANLDKLQSEYKYADTDKDKVVRIFKEFVQ